MPTLIPSTTLGRVAGATGQSTQGHLVFATNQNRWWFFTAIAQASVSGTATGAGQSTTALADSSKSWTTNQWADYIVWLTGGTGAGQLGHIASNTATTLTLKAAAEPTWATAPVAGSTTYEIMNLQRIRVWVSSGPDLTTATWSEATGSASGIIFDNSTSVNLDGNSIAESGGSGIAPADGRNWCVGYANVSSTDVVHLVCQVWQHWSSYTARARLTGPSTITWDTVGATGGWVATGAGQDGVPESPMGKAICLNTNSLWVSMDCNLQSTNGGEPSGRFDTTTENGSNNLANGWQTSANLYDSSAVFNGWGGAIAALASGFALAVYSDGQPSDNTGTVYQNLRFAETASATAWPTTNTGANIPNLSAAQNDPNDWGMVARTTSDIHVVRRNAATTLEQVRYSGHGGSWGSKVTLPTGGLTGHAAGSGVALVSDGTNVWCFVIDTDVNNSVRYIKWNGSTWDASWSTLSTGTEAKKFITATMRSDNGQIGVAWTANSSAPFAVNFAALSLGGATASPPPSAFPRVSGLTVG